MDVPSGQIRAGPLAHVLVLDTHWAAGLWGGAAVLAPAGLNAGLLVGTDDEVVLPQWPPLPDAFVEVEDSARLLGCRVPSSCCGAPPAGRTHTRASAVTSTTAAIILNIAPPDSASLARPTF
jgi:hypothetical protein